ncbi:aldehyde dehydrogenase family protein [Cryptosporangium sp. NPDC048952]|uniref:aldehyde dehydrogenase family protein n=1 Tax=Cryptosporangium sp. NPDC048952 TaxID=3363961 RepID=UPI00371C4FAC
MTSLGDRLLIDGELVTAGSGRTFDNLNPATEEVIGAAPDADATDVEKAIGAARRAFDTSNWSTDVEFRRHCLTQLRDALRANVDELRTIVVSEAGSPVSLTGAIQLEDPIRFIDHYIDLLGTYEFERPLPEKEFYGTATSRVVRREAAGVVAAITPWNYPFYLNIAKVAAALAAGCTVVLKPAPDTPFSALALGAIAAEHTDLPAGVLNVVSTSDNAVAQILATHPDVDHVTLTGSTGTGRKVMGAASETIKRVTLELGGKSAAVVLDDADLTQIVPGLAMGICVHAGQGCAALTRLLVPRNKLDEAVGILAGAMGQMPWGDPTDPGNIMGPVINAAQRDKVLSYYEAGAREGRIAVGGKPQDRFDRGFFVEPTVITDIDPKSSVAQDEIFGPVIVVLPFDDDEDALRIADNTIFGLSAAVHSADFDRALNLARRMRTGTVGVNGGMWFDVQSPFGGYKQSGIGREWGTEGLEDFLETKTIAWPTAAG